MDQNTLAGIIGLLLAIPLWRLYHRIFTVFYRDVFWGIIGEIFAAYATGYFISSFLLQNLGGLLIMLLTWAVQVLIIALLILTLCAYAMDIWMHRNNIKPYEAGNPTLDAYTALQNQLDRRN